jgi:hypothetical protein
LVSFWTTTSFLDSVVEVDMESISSPDGKQSCWDNRQGKRRENDQNRNKEEKWRDQNQNKQINNNQKKKAQVQWSQTREKGPLHLLLVLDRSFDFSNYDILILSFIFNPSPDRILSRDHSMKGEWVLKLLNI